MKGHGTQFGRKKEEAIVALLTQRNIEEAARSIGVTPNTLLKWQRLPEFQTAYRKPAGQHSAKRLRGSSRESNVDPTRVWPRRPRGRWESVSENFGLSSNAGRAVRSYR